VQAMAIEMTASEARVSLAEDANVVLTKG
jgi:hypothetical protein